MKLATRAIRALARPIGVKGGRRYTTEEPLKRTPFYNLHVQLGGKMVPFAGYEMPVQYPDGILQGHLHCRQKASLFDVSHMGQIKVEGADRVKFLERLTVADVESLPLNTAVYSLFTNKNGGIIDDTIITNRGDFLYVVVNAGCFEKDWAHIQAEVAKEPNVKVTNMSDYALLAIQGPLAEQSLQKLIPSGLTNLSNLKFFQGAEVLINNVRCWIQRTGYTGEDGFEISIPKDKCVDVAWALLADPNVKPCGLGARDSLRLECGLSLYGHDINEETTPKTASLLWAIGKRRKENGGFIGDHIIIPELKVETKQKRVGLNIQGAPAREGAPVFDPATNKKIGVVTSGTFSPILKQAIAMAYVDTPFSKIDTPVQVEVRGRLNTGKVAKMPFVPTNYKK